MTIHYPCPTDGTALQHGRDCDRAYTKLVLANMGLYDRIESRYDDFVDDDSPEQWVLFAREQALTAVPKLRTLARQAQVDLDRIVDAFLDDLRDRDSDIIFESMTQSVDA